MRAAGFARSGSPLLLSALACACTAEVAPLSIQVDFAAAFPTMVLTLIEAKQSTSYVIDLRNGAGIEELPRLSVSDAAEAQLYARLYERPYRDYTDATGPVDVAEQGTALPPPAETWSQRITLTSTGGWTRAADNALPPLRSASFKAEPICLDLKFSAPLPLPGATEPISATALLSNQHVLLFTGREQVGRLDAPFALRIYDYNSLTDVVAELHASGFDELKALPARVNAAVQVGVPVYLAVAPRAGGSQLWRGTIMGGFHKLLDLPTPTKVVAMSAVPLDSPRALLLITEQGGLFRVELDGLAVSALVPERVRPNPYCNRQDAAPDRNFDVFGTCAGISPTRDPETFIVNRPHGDLLARLSLSGALTPLTVPIGLEESYLPPAVTIDGTFTFQTETAQVITRMFRLEGDEFKLLTELGVQQPTALIAHGRNLIFGGRFGYVQTWSPEQAICHDYPGALRGMWPSEFLKLSAGSWLVSGYSPEARAFVVRMDVK